MDLFFVATFLSIIINQTRTIFAGPYLFRLRIKTVTFQPQLFEPRKTPLITSKGPQLEQYLEH